MYIAVGQGPNEKTRVPMRCGFDTRQETLVSVCEAHRQTHKIVFLEFEEGLFYPLIGEQCTAMACAMVAMAHRRRSDDDGWIEEAHAMCEATQQHMLESSSEDEERGSLPDEEGHEFLD